MFFEPRERKIKMKLLLTFLFCVYFAAQNVVAKAAPSSSDAILFIDDYDENDDILKSDGPNEIVSKRGRKEDKDLQLNGFFQGDIKLTEAQKSDFTSRTGVRFDYQKWTKNDEGFAIVPYKIDDYVYGQYCACL